MSAVAGARPAQSLLLWPRRRAPRDGACGYGGGVRWTCGRQRMTTPSPSRTKPRKGGGRPRPAGGDCTSTLAPRRKGPPGGGGGGGTRGGGGGRADPGAMLAATASPLVLSLRLGATFHLEGREGDVRCHPSTGAPTAWPR